MKKERALRALTANNLMDKKYQLFDFDNEWYDFVGTPEVNGVWFVWGNSGNGKTTFVLELVKYLSTFVKVAYNSLEEGFSHTMQNSFRNVNMTNSYAKRVLIVNESIDELSTRLLKKNSPHAVIIDSFQYSQLNYKQYIEFKKKHHRKLIIFVSHADGKQPSGRAAKSVMYDSTLKIWVEGYKAFTKGRYIGTTGEYLIWAAGAVKYWGEI